jgi:Fe2+ or Zn2+ uptake regulation protein
MPMSVVQHEPGSDAARLRQRGLRVTGPRLAILSMLERVGGHRSADELVLALRRGGYHHARTTVYNALDDLARAGLVRAAPVDAGALRYESAGPAHHHFVCRECGSIHNVPLSDDPRPHPMPPIEGAELDELDVVYRGRCPACAATSRAKAAEERPGEQDRAVSGPAPLYGRDGAMGGGNTMSTGMSGTATGSLLDLRGR